jgi:uncharacterized protein with PIN domain
VSRSLISQLGLEIEPVTASQISLAEAAYASFGKGCTRSA